VSVKVVFPGTVTVAAPPLTTTAGPGAMLLPALVWKYCSEVGAGRWASDRFNVCALEEVFCPTRVRRLVTGSWKASILMLVLLEVAPMRCAPMGIHLKS